MVNEIQKCQYLKCSNPADININGFCSKVCQAKQKRAEGYRKFMNSKPKGWKATCWTPEMKSKHGILLKAIYEEKGSNLKRKRSLQKRFGTRAAIKALSYKLSLAQNRAIAKRTGNTYVSTKGIFLSTETKIPFKSEWERIAMQKLDENPEVIKWFYLNDSLYYFEENDLDHPHHLVVDFQVNFKDGNTKYLLIRPFGFSRRFIKNRDLEQIQQECEKKNVKLEVWSEENLK